MTITQAQIGFGQMEIVDDLNANFDEIVRIVENGY